MKPIKILHITDLHYRHNGRLFYSTGKKINNGLINNGHNVLNISDRDLTSQNKSLIDFNSKKKLLQTIKQNIINFSPDMILMGHVDRIDYEMFYNLRSEFKSTKFSQWFLDPLIKTGPDYDKNKERLLLKYQFCDANFITTSPDEIDFINKENSYYIPNPIDPSIDVYKNYLKNKEFDMFIAISHGQHRAVLKEFFTDNRVFLIKKLTQKINYNIFGFNRNPIWGQNFFNELSKCSMGLNLSRGDPIKYYSSDRIASLLGNGLLTFIHEDYCYKDFLENDEFVSFKNIADLNKKIIYFKNRPKKLRSVAKKGYLKSHKIFNNKLIAEFIVKKTMNFKFDSNINWCNV